MNIPRGYCQCGCGQKTKPYKTTRGHLGHIKGELALFLQYHRKRGNNSRKLIFNAKHHRATSNGYVHEYILIAEKALGKPLPKNTEIHHVNGNPNDNSSGNLVICPNRAYHKLLHRRTTAYKACGHANWRKCSICNNYDHPDNLYIELKGWHVHHRHCYNKARVR